MQDGMGLGSARDRSWTTAVSLGIASACFAVLTSHDYPQTVRTLRTRAAQTQWTERMAAEEA